MRSSLVSIIIAMCVAGAAFAQAEKPSMDLPIYPGSETAMEINMSNEDILPMAKAMLPLLSGKLGPMLDKIDVQDLADVMKDVRQIQFVQLDISDEKVTEKDITAYYAKNIPSGEWSRVLWQNAAKKGTFALYTQKDVEGIYGFRARSMVLDGKNVKRVEVAKICGKIDYVKLLQMAGKMGFGKS
jgi:hypothetical protein